jgi:hypothetical protein
MYIRHSALQGRRPFDWLKALSIEPHTPFSIAATMSSTSSPLGQQDQRNTAQVAPQQTILPSTTGLPTVAAPMHEDKQARAGGASRALAARGARNLPEVPIECQPRYWTLTAV